MTTTDLSQRPAGARPPGRPLSTELSDQLVAVAMDILADEGWGRLNSDRVAARARAGKAGIYRRWPTMAALARHALSTATLVEVPADQGALATDLCALLLPWTRPLDRAERAAASLVGAARHDEELRAGLEEALVRPLATAAPSGRTRAVSSPARSSSSCRAAPTRLATARSSRSSGRVQRAASATRSSRKDPASAGVETREKRPTASRARAAIVGQRR